MLDSFFIKIDKVPVPELFYDFRCQNIEGSFTCTCPQGLIGDPLKNGCKQPGDCFTDTDCPNSAACIDNTCHDPCSKPFVCGRNAQCLTKDHIPHCRCPGQTTGDPQVRRIFIRRGIEHSKNKRLSNI